MENFSLRSWWDFAREWFQCFGREAVNASGEAVRGLVKLANSLAGFPNPGRQLRRLRLS